MTEAMAIPVFLFFVALAIFYARARAVVRQEMEDPNDDRLDEELYYDVDSPEERAWRRVALRKRGFSKQEIERWLARDRSIARMERARQMYGRDPFPSRALAKRD